LFFFDENWGAVRQWREKRRLLNSPAAADHLAARWPVRMRPGTYRISLEVLDPKSGRSGAERETVAIEDFSSDRLHISSVVLAVSDSSNSDLELYRNHDVHLVPVFSQDFFSETPIYVYYEIYNLALDAGGHSRYHIDYVVEPRPENKGLISRAAIRLGKLLGWRRQSVAIGSTFEATGGSPDEKLYQRLEILGQPAGRYHLTIRVTDQISGQSASRRAALAIKQKKKNND
jgi:hypothetical protein